MKIQWIRVLVAGFLIEVVLAVVLIGGFALAGVRLQNGVSTGSAIIIGTGAFVAAFLVVLWFGRRITNHIVLHGFLIGVVATLLYFALVVGSGQMSAALAAYGPATFITVNGARIVGAVFGGIVSGRRRAVIAQGAGPANPV
jgi:uncharacterized PurR-regulated membrane protein YhhQ (DUF165 family)